MSKSSVNNSRIVKNTLFLYARMLLGMCVSLYTSRIILDALGATNYGVFNVVGSVVTMSAFLNGAVVTSTQRYITFHLGKGEMNTLQRVFTTSVQIHFCLALLVVILADTIGLWFLYNKMVIPADRIDMAFWVLQISLFTMFVNIMSGPYNSLIIAHERMDVFAYISLLNIFLNLFLAFVLYISPIDRLLLYGLSLAIVQILIRILYSRYCLKHYEEAKLIKVFDKGLIKEMSSFAGWNIWGNLAGILFGQGINMLLNVFFGPIVNAARGIAIQVDHAVNHFARNFLVAVDPQITKSYANNELSQMHKLIFRSSKFTFFLMFMLSLPILVETESILDIWLVSPPEYTAIFIRLTLIIVIIDAVARPFMTGAAATGNVKLYQSVVGGILLTIVPVAYIVLKLGGSPSSVFFVHLTICLITFVVRLFIVKSLIHFSIWDYVHFTVFKIVEVASISLAVVLFIKFILPSGIVSSILVCAFSVIIVCLSSFYVGMSSNERAFVFQKIKFLKKKFIK